MSSSDASPTALPSLGAEPAFPPLLAGRRNVDGASAFKSAIAAVEGRSLGAGDVLWNDDPSHIELAIVLEPDVPLRAAAQMLPLFLVSVGDCIGALAPPQVGVTFRWPNEIRVNDAPVGEVETACSTTDGDVVPDWLVLGLRLRLHHDLSDQEPGHVKGITSLAEEGCGELTATEFMESVARHFLTWLNIWQDEGFRPVHSNLIGRLEGQDEPTVLAGARGGLMTVAGLDEDGNLLARDSEGQVVLFPLVEAIAK